MLYRFVYRFICPLFRFLKRYTRLLSLIPLLIAIFVIGPIIYAKIYQHWDEDEDRGAIAISDGAYGESYLIPRYLDQGWEEEDSLWFYNTTQGSGLLPYDFFLVLEQAGTEELLRSPKNIDRFRYLPQKKTLFNHDGLPVGFVKETYQGKDYVGYTCAACHTGQVNYQGAALRIDGGPAMADMVGFLTALQKAMEAAQSGEKNIKFIAAVKALKNNYGGENADKNITDDLKKWTNALDLYNTVNHSNVEYGHARLDAFGRIYNRVIQHTISVDQVADEMALIVVPSGGGGRRLLSQDQIKNVLQGIGKRIVLNDEDFSLIVKRLQSTDPGFPGLGLKDLLYVRDKIFDAPNAPVSYPFLWDIAQSDYVQWNGLASNAGIGPLGRNTGEVIGVFGILDWGKDTSWLGLYPKLANFSLSAIISGQENKRDVIDFKSSIDLFNLQRLESHLRSLKSPQWPFCKNDKGEHYLPPTTGKEAISPEREGYCSGNDKRFNEAMKGRGELLYNKHCLSCHTVVDRGAWDRVVVGKMLAIDKAGTDRAMAENSLNTGKSGNFKDTYQAVDVGSVVIQEEAPVVQILTAATRGVVATEDADKWFPRRWIEWVYALVMTFTDNTIKPSVKSGDYDPDTTSKPYASLLSYKARSLNGIWATAPYLHNGSVPTLDDLLLPADKRPAEFRVGRREFDPNKVGFKSDGEQGSKFNTTVQRGNHNTGHEYRIVFTDEQRRDLIEYLKSL